jgi:hypothetical protein
MNNVRNLVLELYEREGWKALGYPTWRECLVAEFKQRECYLYNQFEAAQTEKNICAIPSSLAGGFLDGAFIGRSELSVVEILAPCAADKLRVDPPIHRMPWCRGTMHARGAGLN